MQDGQQQFRLLKGLDFPVGSYPESPYQRWMQKNGHPI